MKGKPTENSVVVTSWGICRVPDPRFSGRYPEPGTWRYATGVELGLFEKAEHLEDRVDRLERAMHTAVPDFHEYA